MDSKLEVLLVEYSTIYIHLPLPLRITLDLKKVTLLRYVGILLWICQGIVLQNFPSLYPLQQPHSTATLFLPALVVVEGLPPLFANMPVMAAIPPNTPPMTKKLKRVLLPPTSSKLAPCFRRILARTRFLSCLSLRICSWVL